MILPLHSFQRAEEEEMENLLQLSKDILSDQSSLGSLEPLDLNEEKLILAEYESDDEKKTGSR